MRIQRLTFMASACAAALLATTQGASAWFTRVHALNCTKLGSNGTMFSFDSGVGNSGSSSGGRLTVMCPLQDGSASNHQNITILNAHVFDGNSSIDNMVSALPCVGFFSVIGSVCGGLQNTNRISRTFTGQDTLTSGADAAALFTARPGDFKYLKVVMPVAGSLGNSQLSGYYAEGF